MTNKEKTIEVLFIIGLAIIIPTAIKSSVEALLTCLVCLTVYEILRRDR